MYLFWYSAVLGLHTACWCLTPTLGAILDQNSENLSLLLVYTILNTSAKNKTATCYLTGLFLKLTFCPHLFCFLLFCALQWMEVSSIKDPYERGNLCNALFADKSLEHKLYEAIKFIMLYQVIEAYECLNNKQECLPSFFNQLFVRDTSLDPLSYMMNHLNAIGERRGLDQVNMSWKN